MRKWWRMFVVAMLAAFAVWAVCAWFDVGGQRQLFCEGLTREQFDFWMPRMCLEQGYSTFAGARKSEWREGKFVTGDMDKVYPALALLPYKLFPATRTGAWCFAVLGASVFLSALLLVAGRMPGVRFPLFIPRFSFLLFSMPFLFALERGNPIWFSAAAVAVFLAWWDDPVPRRRYLAAVCLAVAAVMKIAPAALGLLYVAKVFGRNSHGCRFRVSPFPELAIAFAAAVVLFAVPWLFVKEGFAAIPIMVKNAANHADYVLRTADFGFVQPWRAVRVALGLDVLEPWSGMHAAARLSQLFGFVALFVGARRRDYLLLVGGMLLAAGNMYYYGALYLLPVFVLEFAGRLSWHSSATSASLSSSAFSACRFLPLWFVVLCPLQLVVFGHSANDVLCNLALMAMMAVRFDALESLTFTSGFPFSRRRRGVFNQQGIGHG